MFSLGFPMLSEYIATNYHYTRQDTSGGSAQRTPCETLRFFRVPISKPDRAKKKRRLIVRPRLPETGKGDSLQAAFFDTDYRIRTKAFKMLTRFLSVPCSAASLFCGSVRTKAFRLSIVSCPFCKLPQATENTR